MHPSRPWPVSGLRGDDNRRGLFLNAEIVVRRVWGGDGVRKRLVHRVRQRLAHGEVWRVVHRERFTVDGTRTRAVRTARDGVVVAHKRRRWRVHHLSAVLADVRERVAPLHRDIVRVAHAVPEWRVNVRGLRHTAPVSLLAKTVVDVRLVRDVVLVLRHLGFIQLIQKGAPRTRRVVGTGIGRGPHVRSLESVGLGRDAVLVVVGVEDVSRRGEVNGGLVVGRGLEGGMHFVVRERGARRGSAGSGRV